MRSGNGPVRLAKEPKEPTALGQRILSACEEAGLTQNAAETRWGQLHGVSSRGYLSRIIDGSRGHQIEPAKAFTLADVLGVEPRWLWTGEGPRKPSTPGDEASLRSELAELRVEVLALRKRVEKTHAPNNARRPKKAV